jgi:DNA-binding XRE family transcriptional regulator
VDAQDLIAWRNAMGWTQNQAADEIGVSRRTYQSLEAGAAAVPRPYELACAALSMIAEKIEIPVYQWPDGSFTTNGSILEGAKLLGHVLAPIGSTVGKDEGGKDALAVPALPNLVRLGNAMAHGQNSTWLLGWKPFPN